MDNGSLYDQFSGFESEPMQEPPARKENAFANRSDNTKPYVSGNQRRSVVVEIEIKDDSYYSWNRFFLSAPAVSNFESKIRGMFVRAYWSPDNFEKMKQDFIFKYKEQLKIENS
jgi:hypothetical protein